jgi:hypothetical protein
MEEREVGGNHQHRGLAIATARVERALLPAAVAVDVGGIRAAAAAERLSEGIRTSLFRIKNFDFLSTTSTRVPHFSRPLREVGSIPPAPIMWGVHSCPPLFAFAPPNPTVYLLQFSNDPTGRGTPDSVPRRKANGLLPARVRKLAVGVSNGCIRALVCSVRCLLATRPGGIDPVSDHVAPASSLPHRRNRSPRSAGFYHRSDYAPGTPS